MTDELYLYIKDDSLCVVLRRIIILTSLKNLWAVGIELSGAQAWRRAPSTAESFLHPLKVRLYGTWFVC